MKPAYVMQIMWHLNDECNLRCRHCYEGDQGAHPIDRWEIQKQAILRIRELLDHYRIVRVGLLGGEPLIDPNIQRIIAVLYENGIERVDLGTNATLIGPDTALALKRIRIKMVQISMEGPYPEINDFIRGSGSFKRAADGLAQLKRQDIDVGIMMTVSKLNLGLMEEMVKFAADNRAQLISFSRLLPLGSSKKGPLEMLEPHQLKEMVYSVRRLKEKYRTIDISSDEPLLHLPEENETLDKNRMGGCGAGVGNLTINYNGDVFPCRRLPIKIGDINTRLIEIINSLELDCFYNRKKFFKGACGRCEYTQICGGCRAAAYSYTGDFLNPDPQCWKIHEERR